MNKEAIEQIIRGMTYMVNDTINNNMTKVYDGIVISNNNDGRWNVKYNGETHPVKPYGPIMPDVNTIVKVIVPQGNQALSWFFIPGSDTGGGGNNGVTFIPSVSEDGIISWTNNGGLPNPTPIDIMGPQGMQGQIGPQGDRGETGYYYTPLVDDNGNLSWTNNGSLENPATVNIKGPQGQQGIQGVQGPRGEQGIQGNPGPYFIPNVNTNGDLSWSNNGGLINPSTVNIKGPQGEQGTIGPIGPQGEQGEPGYYFTPSVDTNGNLSWTNNGNLENPETTNIKGPQGEQGIQGIQGEQGPQGIQGETGYYFTPSLNNDGDLSWSNNGGLNNPVTVNIKGPQGPTGETGPEGPQGEQGIQGPQGNTGPYFTPSVDSNGDLSWTNNGNLTNPTTVNIKGPQGDVGPTGPQGEQGIQGIQGPAGTNGTNGENGATFTPTVSDTGDLSWTNDKGLDNPATVNIKGPQGPQGKPGQDGKQGIQGPEGPQGATGPAGADGKDGIAATIQIGTVTTGAAGTQATVTNTGTTNAAVFNFTIPQGVAGQDGADATVNGVNTLTIKTTGGLTGTQSGNTYSISGENLPYLKTTGGTLTGNLTGRHLTGTWLQSTAVYELSSSNFKGVCVFDGSGWVYYRTKEHFLADIGAVTQDYVDTAVANASGVKKFSGTLGPNSWATSGGNYQYQAQVNISDMTAESNPNAYPQWTNQSVESIEWNKLATIESFDGYVIFYSNTKFTTEVDYTLTY